MLKRPKELLLHVTSVIMILFSLVYLVPGVIMAASGGAMLDGALLTSALGLLFVVGGVYGIWFIYNKQKLRTAIALVGVLIVCRALYAAFYLGTLDVKDLAFYLSFAVPLVQGLVVLWVNADPKRAERLKNK